MGVGGRRGHQSYPSTTPAPIAYHRVPWYGKVAPSLTNASVNSSCADQRPSRKDSTMERITWQQTT